MTMREDRADTLLDISDETGPPSALEQAFPWLSTVSLVVANLIPLAGVLCWGWSIFAIMFLFWAENIVVGVVNILRMLVCKPDQPMGWLVKLFFIPFFTFHYGMFCAGHGLFVLLLFGGMGQAVGVMEHFGPRTILDLLQLGLRGQPGITYAVIGLAISHLISFGVNFIGRGEYRRADASTLMHRPYGRIVVLHLTLLFGAFLLTLTGLKGAAAALLVALKLGMDLKAHLKERQKLAGTG